MKVSEMIKNLQHFQNEFGDLDCWYAVDNEGSGYNEVYFTPSLYHIDEYDTLFSDTDDIEEAGYKLEDLQPVCVIN